MCLYNRHKDASLNYRTTSVSKPRLITSLSVFSAHQLEKRFKCAKIKTDITFLLKLFVVNLVAQHVYTRQLKLQSVKTDEQSQDLYSI